MSIEPYSDNIIFFDSEFSSLDPYKGEIVSLGLIKYDGQELYLEIDFKGELDSWPKENILPSLSKDKVSQSQAIESIKNFIGENKPYVVAYVNQFDMIYFYKLLGLDNFNDKFNWIPIDFASMLFSQNLNPELLTDWNSEFINGLKIDIKNLKHHNALDDAKFLREVYMKMMNKS